MKTKAFIYVIIAGIAWGTSGIFVHLLAPYGYTSLQMTALRGSVSFLCLSAYLLIRDRKMFCAKPRDLLLYVGIGASLFGTASCYFTSMQMTSISTAVVLLAALISHFTPLVIDSYCGVLVGLLILYAGYKAAKETLNPLMGTPPEPEFVQKVEGIVMSYDNVLGIHDLIVHNYGPGRTIISLHAEVSADGDLLALHDTIDLIEHRLHNDLNCSAVIHMDPVCIHDELTRELKEIVSRILDEIDPVITMHDFRIVSGPTHTNLIFDIVVPFNFRYTDEALTRLIAGRVRAFDPTYYTVIEVDKSYI